MHVFDLIKQRRSIGKMTGERPTREQIELLLEAATHAPIIIMHNPGNSLCWQDMLVKNSAQ